MKYKGDQKIYDDGYTPLIRLNRVSRFYKGDRAALFDISFDVAPREFIYVAGSSGAGKSTLLRMLYGAVLPDTGTVFFSGCSINDLKPAAISIVRRSMGVIFQDFLLIPDLSVMANVGLPLEVAGLSRSAIAKRVKEMLGCVGLSDRAADLAGNLSGGEQQRVAIARAMIGNPEVILADEPTGSLDASSADFVLDLLEQASQRGAAVVLATHDKMLMAARPHRVVALNRGRMVGMSPGETQREDMTTEATKEISRLQQTG